MKRINYNITNLDIKWASEIDCILYNFQEQFPKLEELKLDFYSSKSNYNNGTIEITEKKIPKLINFLYQHDIIIKYNCILEYIKI